MLTFTRCSVHLMNGQVAAAGIKVLEWPGIEPGTIHYLDWMLYH